MENPMIEAISERKLVPVVKIEDQADAAPLAEALLSGGLPCAEITFRTEAAPAAISEISKRYPEMLVGAGTVLSTEQADLAMQNGAKFIVSPGLNPKVVRHCIEKGYPVLPGICTPTEAEAAMELGLRFVKFFPAEAAGGLPMIKAMSAPYPMLRFMPTGGISRNNLLSYLAFPAVFACGGSFMVPSDALKEKNFEKIRVLTSEAVALLNRTPDSAN